MTYTPRCTERSWTCETCGALVEQDNAARDLHDAWHERLAAADLPVQGEQPS